MPPITTSESSLPSNPSHHDGPLCLRSPLPRTLFPKHPQLTPSLSSPDAFPSCPQPRSLHLHGSPSTCRTTYLLLRRGVCVCVGLSHQVSSQGTGTVCFALCCFPSTCSVNICWMDQWSQVSITGQMGRLHEQDGPSLYIIYSGKHADHPPSTLWGQVGTE